MSERVYGGRSAQERDELRREQLLAAGLDVFAAKGWSASTVQDVCRAAALSPRYFYELFDSREDLFVAVTSRIAEQVRQTVRAALAEPADAPEQRVRAVLTALTGFFAADDRLVRVALLESMATERLRVHRRELLEGFSDTAARLMRSLHGAPAGRAQNRRLALSATVLTGGMVEVLVAQDGSGRPLPADLLVDHLGDLFVAAAAL